MPENISQDAAKKICLLGISFDTGNMGISTLAETSIKCVLNRWPDAEITLLGSGYCEDDLCIKIDGNDVRVRQVPVRLSKNVFLPNHFCVFMMYALLFKLLGLRRFKNASIRRNRYLKAIVETDIAADVTGGDSFSDIYGLGRFFKGLSSKMIVLGFGRKLVMLPQTYGPFTRAITKSAAKYVINRADAVYSRDKSGVKYLHQLWGKGNSNGKVRFLPDMGFVLDSSKPVTLDMGGLQENLDQDRAIVGVNVSGLLFNGGYNCNNMFELRCDYPQVVCDIVEMLLRGSDVMVLLIPHVFPAPQDEVESDPQACRKVYEKLGEKYPGRIFYLHGQYNHNEIKYVIGLCDFFVGSRMHACIAAMSQGIATVGLAYSRKFKGVFESVDAGDFVIDMTKMQEDEILETVAAAFVKRHAISEGLNKTIPDIQQNVIRIFDEVSC